MLGRHGLGLLRLGETGLACVEIELIRVRLCWLGLVFFPVCNSLKATCHCDPPISMLTPKIDTRKRHCLTHTIIHHTIVVYSGLSASSLCRSNFGLLRFSCNCFVRPRLLQTRRAYYICCQCTRGCYSRQPKFDIGAWPLQPRTKARRSWLIQLCFSSW